MERLTYDFALGGNHCWQVKGADNLECREVCERQGDNGCKTCPIAKTFDRLAAYEDTGLEPEDLKRAFNEDDVLKLAGQALGITPERLRELVQADNEGLCVVLPFKPPRWVYMCSARFPKPAKAYYASAINVLQDMDNGCVFGDTPKEAEDALRREQDG